MFRLFQFIASSHCLQTTPKASLSKLKDVLFIGNPMYDEAADKDEARPRVLARLPQVTKIDGDLVKPSEVEASRIYVED